MPQFIKRPGLKGQYVCEPGPHIRARESVRSRMWKNLAATLPVVTASAILFGLTAVRILLACIIPFVLIEMLYDYQQGNPGGRNLARAVTSAVLLAMMLPPGLGTEMAVLGSVFAVVFGKLIFGPLGSQPFHEALVGRMFLQFSFPLAMARLIVPGREGLAASPVTLMRAGHPELLPDITRLLTGHYAGPMGETCAIAIAISAAALFYFKLISWRPPLIYLVTVALSGLAFGFPPGPGLLSGGSLFAAFFLLSDSAAMPLSDRARNAVALIAGLLTVLLRAGTFGAYASGTAVFVACLLNPWLERWLRPRKDAMLSA